jgi:hypothetical protein
MITKQFLNHGIAKPTQAVYSMIASLPPGRDVKSTSMHRTKGDRDCDFVFAHHLRASLRSLAHRSPNTILLSFAVPI